jgi:predicted NUDIX family NTP pyrophosphohydrolase
MKLVKKANLIMYRFREKGLEIFLVNKDQDQWEIPTSELDHQKSNKLIEEQEAIALDPIKKADGKEEEAVAMECDWHEIPSLKSMIYEDAMEMTNKVKEMEKGTFFVVKEAFKKVLPHQYEFLKELKDVLTDRNSLKNM